jgi:hypothetical protein
MIQFDREKLQPVTFPLIGFAGDKVHPIGTIDLPVTAGTPPRQAIVMVSFLVVSCPSAYSAILGRTSLYNLGGSLSLWNCAQSQKERHLLPSSFSWIDSNLIYVFIDLLHRQNPMFKNILLQLNPEDKYCRIHLANEDNQMKRMNWKKLIEQWVALVVERLKAPSIQLH